MGFVHSAVALIVSLISIGMSRISDVKRTRVKFDIVSAVLYGLWYFTLAHVQNVIEVI